MAAVAETGAWLPAGDSGSAGTAVLDRHGAYLGIDEAACSLLGVTSRESIGTASFARIPVDADEVWWLEQRPEVTGTPLVCRVVRGEDGGRWELSLVPESLSTSTRRLVESYEKRALEAVASPDRDASCRTLADTFGEICGFIGCLIVLIDEETGDPTFAGGSHAHRGMLGAMEECRRRGARLVVWQAFTENRVVVANEWYARVAHDSRLAPIRPYLELGPSRSGGAFVAVPLALAGKRMGVMAGMVLEPASISPEGMGLCWELAQRTALALRCAEAIRTAHASGRDRERRRLNEDLHDSVVQDMFALRMLVARAEVDSGRAGVPDLAERIAELRALSDKIFTGLRALIGERRQVREALRLSQQLTGLAREMGSRSGVEIQANVGEEWDHLSSECRDTVVRIVQEALRNIAKHAHARTASLRVGEDAAAPGMLLIEVVDDGESFDPDASSSVSFGLTSIRERVAEHGGSVEIRTAPRTTLRVRIRPSFESEWDAVARR
jgi:signal transduction histidine kinase